MPKRAPKGLIADNRRSRNVSKEWRVLSAITKVFSTKSARQKSKSESEIKLNESCLKVHSVEGIHVASGKYLYEAKLKCNNEHSWTIRFSMAEFNLAFSKAERLKETVKHGFCTCFTGPRETVHKGRPTGEMAKQDRIRRCLWNITKYASAAIIFGLFSLCIRKCLIYVVSESWSDANLWLLSLSLAVIFRIMYWLFDSFILQMMPRSFLHQYHQSQKEEIKRRLMKKLKSPNFLTNLQDHQSLQNFLKFSVHSLRRRLPVVIKEGNAMCRVNGRSEFESDQHDSSTQIEGGCCRCSIEFGFDRKWHRRWCVLRSTGISFFRYAPGAKDKSPTHIILFDNTFYASKGGGSVVIDAASGPSPTLLVAGSNAMCELAFSTVHDRDEWYKAFQFMIANSNNNNIGNGNNRNNNNSENGGWTTEHRFGSFAPRRSTDNLMLGVPPKQKQASVPSARWILNGRSYYALVADAISKAKSEVFITGWFLTPEILLTRKATTTPNEIDWSLKKACLEIANKGIPVYILIYQEIPQALANNSLRAQKELEGLHKSIHVLRHRSRFTRNVYWSHHEKTVIIDQNVAFVGGIDLALMRYDDSNHTLYDGNDGGNDVSLILMLYFTPPLPLPIKFPCIT